MHRLGLGAVLLSLICLPLLAATEPIGVAVSAGNIVVNNASAAGNATVFEGAMLGSGSKASTQVRLTNGARVRLALDSSGKMYLDHVDLLTGSAEISGYSANANGMKVSAEGKSSAAVSVQGKSIQVAALSGDVHVFNSRGITVANLLPGRVMNFLPQPQDAGASAPSQLTGCPVRSGANFLLTDETSNVTAQLRGGNVKAGRRVQITGTMVPNAAPPAGATQVISVTGVKEVGGDCKGAAAAGTAGAGAGTGGGSHAGVALGIAAVVVIAGVSAGVVATSGGSSNALPAGVAQATCYTSTGAGSTCYKNSAGLVAASPSGPFVSTTSFNGGVSTEPPSTSCPFISQEQGQC
jgi:hypothetical protein